MSGWRRLRPNGRALLARRELVFVAGVTIVGLCLRLLWVLAIPNAPYSDFARYQATADQIFRGVDAPGLGFQGAGYPIALGLVYRVFGSSDILIGKLFNVALGTATLPLVYLVFRRLSAVRAVVWGATIVVALLPTYIAYSAILGTETLFTLLFVAVVALQLSDRDWRWRCPLLGVLSGAAMLTKPYFVLYPAVLALVWLVSRGNRRHLDLRRLDPRRITPLALSLVCMALTLAPWTLRNYARYGEFIPSTFDTGYVLFVNDNSDNTAGGWMPFSQIHVSDAFKQELQQKGITYGDASIPLDERFIPVEPLFRAAAERWIVTHPIQYLQLGVLRVTNTFFSGGGDEISFWAMRGISPQEKTTNLLLRDFLSLTSVLNYLLAAAGAFFLVTGLAGLLRRMWWFLRRGARSPTVGAPSVPTSAVSAMPSAVVTINIGFFVLVFFLFEGQGRYAFPLLWLFAFCLAYAAHALRRYFQMDALGDSRGDGGAQSLALQQADVSAGRALAAEHAPFE